MRSHWLIWCRADQCSLCIFWLSHHLTLDKSISSKLKKIGNYMRKILGSSAEPKTGIRSPEPELFQWSENHNNDCLTGLRAPFPVGPLNPRLPRRQLSRKSSGFSQTYCNPTEIDFALTWNEKKPIDPGLIRVRFATSCHRSANETNE